jgi:hypothetical protein
MMTMGDNSEWWDKDVKSGRKMEVKAILGASKQW